MERNVKEGIGLRYIVASPTELFAIQCKDGESISNYTDEYEQDLYSKMFFLALVKEDKHEYRFAERLYESVFYGAGSNEYKYLSALRLAIINIKTEDIYAAKFMYDIAYSKCDEWSRDGVMDYLFVAEYLMLIKDNYLDILNTLNMAYNKSLDYRVNISGYLWLYCSFYDELKRCGTIDELNDFRNIISNIANTSELTNKTEELVERTLG